MSCETARRLMESNDPGLVEHQQRCASCVIGANAPYYEAPAGLEQKIRRSLNQETNERSYWRWIAIAASVLLVSSLAANVELLRSRVSTNQVMAESVLSAHLRSLEGTHLLDVPSSDRHTVKPWFNGKLDFSPPVRTVEGFPLLGGRLEYLNGRSVAGLIYGRDKHIINLFVWPQLDPVHDQNVTRNGYNMYNWSEGGMMFWTVSDLNEAELQKFIGLYRQDPR